MSSDERVIVTMDKMDDLRSYLPPESIDCVVYHAQCSDGFGAAYCFWKYWVEKGFDKNTIEDRILFIPYSHLNSDDEIKSELFPLIKSKNVVYLDMCPKASLFEDMVVNLPNKAIVIDHHESSYGATKKINEYIVNERCYFDMSHSGCVLAHTFVFPDRPTPLFLQCIEDRDIWCWNIESISKPFVEAFYTCVPFDFEEYHRYEHHENVKALVAEGTTLRKFKLYRIAELAQRA